MAASSVGKWPRVLMIFLSSMFRLSKRVGRVDDAPDLAREGQERHHVLPRPAPGQRDRRVLGAPRACGKRLEQQRGRFCVGRGIDRLERASQRLALLPARVLEACADQVHDARLHGRPGICRPDGLGQAVEPRPYMAMMRSSKPRNMHSCFGIRIGSKLPSRSRGASTRTTPSSANTVQALSAVALLTLTLGLGCPWVHSPGGRSSRRPCSARSRPSVERQHPVLRLLGTHRARDQSIEQPSRQLR